VETQIKAIVQKVIANGKHGPYAVAINENLTGSITFSLNPTVWKEKNHPEPGSMVYLSKIRQKRAGWRAEEGRFWNLSDEQSEQSEKSKIVDKIIKFVEDLYTCAISIETEEEIKELANPLDLDTLISMSKTVISAPTYCGCYNSKGNIDRAWGQLIFSKVKEEKDLEKLTLSKEVSFSWEKIFEKAIEIKSKKLIIEALPKISNLEEFDLSVPMQLMNTDEKKDLLNSIILAFENETNSALQKRKAYYEETKDDLLASYNNPFCGIYLEIEESHLFSRLKVIKIMLDSGIELQNPKERIAKIAEHIGYIEKRPNSNYASARSFADKIKQDFAEVSSKALPPDIVGEGLEFVSNAGGQTLAYLNGDLVGEIGDAQNIEVKGDSMVWTKTFEFDRDVNSVQYKSCIFAWKKGWKEPKEIYERHAWTRQGTLFVEFKFDGKTVEVSSSIDGKDKNNEKIPLI